jgi:hypothetical protein
MSARKSGIGRLFAITLVALAMLGVGAQSANADLLRNVSGGESKLVLNFQSNLQMAQDNIYAFVLPPAQLDFFCGCVRFPITGGLVQPDTMVGTVNHSGGLEIVKYNEDQTQVIKSFKSTDLKITNGITLIGNALEIVPAPSAQLVDPQHSMAADGTITYQAFADLDLVTATVLNVYFDTNVFTSGQRLGTLQSTIQTTPIL